jgi:hypothetical protein
MSNRWVKVRSTGENAATPATAPEQATSQPVPAATGARWFCPTCYRPLPARPRLRRDARCTSCRRDVGLPVHTKQATSTRSLRKQAVDTDVLDAQYQRGDGHVH